MDSTIQQFVEAAMQQGAIIKSKKKEKHWETHAVQGEIKGVKNVRARLVRNF